jgi:hypothetical protein
MAEYRSKVWGTLQISIQILLPNGIHKSRCRRRRYRANVERIHQRLSFPLATVQLQELHARRFFKFDAEMVADLAQSVIKMRKMIEGHITDERVSDFVITRAPVQPANEEK